MATITSGFSNPVVLAAGLLVALVLLVLQSLRLRRRERELAAITAALVEQERMAVLGRMLAGVAHDLNTPLGAVRCSLGTRQKAVAMLAEAAAGLSSGELPAEDTMVRMNRALQALADTEPVLEEAVARATHLVGELRSAGGGQPAAPQPVDVNELVRGTLLLARHELKDAVTVDLALGEIPAVSGWPGSLGRVVLNLVLNARQALGDGGKLTISTSVNDGQVVLRVVDNGPGLPAGSGNRLFEPGYTTKEAADGSGLGLYISRRIVEKHGGGITAKNVAGGGAEFTVVLPVAGVDDGCIGT